MPDDLTDNVLPKAKQQSKQQNGGGGYPRIKNVKPAGYMSFTNNLFHHKILKKTMIRIEGETTIKISGKFTDRNKLNARLGR